MKISLVFLLFMVSLSLLAHWPQYRGGQHLPGRTGNTIPTEITLDWSFKTGSEIKASPVVWGNKIVVGSTDNHVYCLNLNGKLLWSFKATNAIEAPALIRNNRVFIGDLSGMFYALDLQTGIPLWKYQANNQFSGSASWFHDRAGREYIVAASYDFFLYCFDAQTGRLMWKYEAQNYLHATPALWNGQAVFGGCDGLLHFVALTNGKSLGTLALATYIASAASIHNNKAFVGDYDGKFSAIDLKTRQVVWTFKSDQRQLPFIGSPAIAGNKVMVGNRDRHVYALNATNGQLIWKKNTGNPVDSSPLTDGRNVLVSNMRGDLLLLNINNGNVVWTYELGSGIQGNPAVVNRRIIVGANDGYLYCFIGK